jgi:hypothetical protein
MHLRERRAPVYLRRAGGAVGSTGPKVRVSESQLTSQPEGRVSRDCYVLTRAKPLSDRLNAVTATRFPAFYWSESGNVYKPVDLVPSITLNIHERLDRGGGEISKGNKPLSVEYNPMVGAGGSDASRQLCRLTDDEWSDLWSTFSGVAAKPRPEAKSRAAQSEAVNAKYPNQCMTFYGWSQKNNPGGRPCQCENPEGPGHWAKEDFPICVRDAVPATSSAFGSMAQTPAFASAAVRIRGPPNLALPPAQLSFPATFGIPPSSGGGFSPNRARPPPSPSHLAFIRRPIPHHFQNP